MIWREISSWCLSFWLMGSSRRAARRRMNQTRSGTSAARRARIEGVILDFRFTIYAGFLVLVLVVALESDLEARSRTRDENDCITAHGLTIDPCSLVE